MCITFVTVGELMKWRVPRSWGPNPQLTRWRQRVGVLEYDDAVAEKWGQLTTARTAPAAQRHLGGRVLPGR